MKWKSIFKPVAAMGADEARKFIAANQADTYQLLDVRQPGEYEQEHISGARLIPLKQLSDRLPELDSEKPTIVYCAVGGRSRAAAQYLSGQGFQEVYNLSGGIKQWSGRKAAGLETQGLELLDVEADYESGLALSYALEDGLQQFYVKLAEMVDDHEQKALLERLASFEDKHKAWLASEYESLHQGVTEPPVPGGKNGLMEGGRPVAQFLARVRPEFLTMEGIFDLAMMFETQAMDLYSRLAVKMQEPTAKDLFTRLVEEEKMHMGYLEKEMNRMLA